MNETETTIAVRLPWQKAQWQRLDTLHQSQKLPHALLLSGPVGIGKYRFAKALAHYLMCSAPLSSMPCGKCRQCLLNLVGTHPDLKILAPEEKSKQIKIDQVRELVSFFGQTAHQGGYKVTLVAPAEAMNVNAANALLKSLEEPGEHSLLILLSNRPSQLLPTIRSRCQVVIFPEPPKDQALAWLKTVLPIAEQAEQLLAETAGRPIAAMELLEAGGASRYKNMQEEFLAMLSGQITAHSVAEKWLEHELDEVLTWLMRHIGNIVRFRIGSAVIDKSWQIVAKGADIKVLYALLDRIKVIQKSLNIGANLNKQLLLEALLLESCEQFHS